MTLNSDIQKHSDAVYFYKSFLKIHSERCVLFYLLVAHLLYCDGMGGQLIADRYQNIQRICHMSN